MTRRPTAYPRLLAPVPAVLVALSLGLVLTPVAASASTPSGDDGCTRSAQLSAEGSPAEEIQLVDAELCEPAIILQPTDEQACKCDQNDSEDGPVAEWGKAWERVVKEWITPLQDFSIAIVGSWLALLVIARLLVFLPWQPFWGKISRWRRNTSLVAGLLALLAAPIAAFSAYAHTRLDGGVAGLPPMPETITYFAVAVIGAALFSNFLAGRLRMSIQVPDKDGKTNGVRASELIGYLNQIGVVPPQGLEIPRGTDVTTLADSGLADATGNKFLAIVQKLISNILGVTPWLITLDETANISSVVITRNGHPERAVNITPSEWRLPDNVEFGPFAGKMAAAAVLSTLASRHKEIVGLCGARDWRSIGLHYFGSTDYKNEPTTAADLYGQAIELDPANFLAEMSYRSVTNRQATKSAQLGAYRDWIQVQLAGLDDRQKSQGGSPREYENVRLRLLLSYLSITRNWLSVAPLDSNRDTELNAAIVRAHEFATILHRKRRVRTTRFRFDQPLHDRMRAIASISIRVLDAQSRFKDCVEATVTEKLNAAIELTKDDFARARNSSSPEIAYSLACFAIRFPKKSGIEPAERNDRLRCAFVSERYREWAPLDPEIASAHKCRWFKNLLRTAIPQPAAATSPVRTNSAAPEPST